jgi:3-oxoacyl-[acyl-carrier protein] reductase
VAQADEVESLVDITVRHFGRLDILVNNAGITHDSLAIRMTDEDWDDVINTNLRGAFLCTRAALRGMVRQRWGRIINMSSIVGRTGNSGQANYSAAKAGLIGMTRSVAREVATRNITVNAIAPGFIETEMTGSLNEAQQKWLLDRIPAQRLGTVQEVASLVIYLSSEEAAYITGQVVQVDGGLAMA